MARIPFDPMKTAAMRDASLRAEVPPPNADLLFEDNAVGGSAAKPLTVGQLNAFLKGELEAILPPVFYVWGEISNFRTYDRGHAFFTLKDSAEIPCIIWKDDLARLKFKPKDGLSVIAKGTVRLYEPQGKLQLYVETLLPQGAGALELAFRQLCEKLRAEGLFEFSRKRPIPKLPRHVAIVTSRTGDVLHDVLTTAWRRFAGLRVSLYPVRVQGAQAAPDIVRAIQRLNAYDPELKSQDSPIDLILLVRGGGSLEDLWAFNEEIVARAIIASRIPIATGIGHEPDTTIADLVGDRGPTPTGVTELTIPDTRALLADVYAKQRLLTREMRRAIAMAQSDLGRVTNQLETTAPESLRNRQMRIDLLCRQIERIEPRHAIAQGWRRVEDSQRRLRSGIGTQERRATERLARLAQRLERASPAARIARQHDRLKLAESRLAVGLQHRLAAATQKLQAMTAQLRAISPQSVLDRGYSITTDKWGQLVRSANQVKRGDVMTTRVADGTIDSTVGKPRQESLF